METISLSKPHKQTKHDFTIPTYIEYETSTHTPNAER